MATLDTSLTVSFGDTDNQISLSLEFERFIPVVGNPAGEAIIRMYPDVDADLFASTGEIEFGEHKRDDHIAEIVTFSQSNTASTQKNMDTNPVIEKSWLFDTETGKKVNNARFTPILGTTEIQCDQTITGAVLVTYKSFYRELLFTMFIEWASNNNLISNPRWTGFATFFKSTILAYYEGAVASLDVSPPALTTPTAEEATEIYRVASYVVVNDEGAWERPDNWPDENTYEDYPGLEGPDVGTAYVEHERVHEIGVVDSFGRFQNRTYFTPRRKPMDTGTDNYHFPYEFVSSYTSQEFTDPACAINYNNIVSYLKKTYNFSDSDITSFGCLNR